MSHNGPRRARSSYAHGESDDSAGRGAQFSSRADRRHAQAAVGASPARGRELDRPSLRYANRSVARHGRLAVTSPSRSIAKGFGLVASVLIATMVVLGAAAAVKFGVALGDRPEINDPAEVLPPLAQIEGGANILVIGSDDRTGQGEEFGEGTDEASGVLNDVNILFHMSEDQSQVTAVSIPRDTVVDTPTCTSDTGEEVYEQEGVPFNSILGEGGMGCVVAAAEQLSDLDIQYAAMVQFRGVIEMSNAVGGVDVCVAQEISDDYVGLYLQPGTHTLKGEDALKFLRSRHGVGDGSDIARISNQQVFLSSLIRTVKSADTLTNPTKIYGLATAVTNNMTLSSSLDLDTMVGFANAVAKIPTENIVFAQLPVADSWQSGRVEPLEPDADQMWQMLRDDVPLTVGGNNTEAPVDGGAGGGDADSSAADTSGEGVADEGTADDSGATDTGAADDSTGVGDASGEQPIDDASGVTTPAPTPAPTVPGQNASQETCSNVE